jgi:putative membrane protein
MPSSFIPYCGLAPLPGATAWNLDPVLMTILAAGAGLYAVGVRHWEPRKSSGLSPQRWAFAVGWAFLAASFISPLCNLGVALFSARVGQHMVLTLLAAPLLVIGGVDLVLARAFGFNAARRSTSEAIISPFLFAFALWFWHAPGPYDAALKSNALYWSMEISLLATSLLLWRCLLRDLSRNPGPALAASLFTGLQMTGLGALLAFAPRVLFNAHLTTSEAWGLSPLQDQQLGGLIMWVPFGVLLAIHAIGAIAAYMQSADRSSQPI